VITVLTPSELLSVCVCDSTLPFCLLLFVSIIEEVVCELVVNMDWCLEQ